MKSLVPAGCSKGKIYLLTTCARQRVKKVKRSASSNLNTLKATCSIQAISWMITHKQICAFAFLASVSAYVTEITYSTMWLELPKIRQSIRNINWIVFMHFILQVIYALDKTRLWTTQARHTISHIISKIYFIPNTPLVGCGCYHGKVQIDVWI